MLMLSLLFGCQNPSQKNLITPDKAKQIVQEAYIYALPVLLWEKQYHRITYTTEPKGLMAPMGQFGHAREFVDASNRMVVGFNVETLYSFAGLDLGDEPFVLSVPDMGDRYWIMQLINAWNDVSAAPGSRTHQGPADFLIAGPKWVGEVPDGLELLRSETDITCIGGRIYSDGEDYELVNKLQDQFILTPLSAWGSNYSPPAKVALQDVEFPVDVNETVMAMGIEEYFNNFNRLLVDNPPYDEDHKIVESMKRIGIDAGKEFLLKNYPKEIARAIEEGFKAGREDLSSILNDLGVIKNGWTLTYEMGRYGIDYDLRAGWSYIGLGGNLIEDAFYPKTQVDGNGENLNGENKYVLRFSKDEIPPSNAFWSLTMYDDEAYLVPNELNRYNLKNIDDLKYGDDESLTIYIQYERPSIDNVSNWLPAPKGEFILTLRVYAPSTKAQSGEWIPPAVQLAN